MSVTAIEKFLRHSSFFFFRKPYPETLKTIKSWGFRYKFTNNEQLKKVISNGNKNEGEMQLIFPIF